MSKLSWIMLFDTSTVCLFMVLSVASVINADSTGTTTTSGTATTTYSLPTNHDHMLTEVISASELGVFSTTVTNAHKRSIDGDGRSTMSGESDPSHSAYTDADTDTCAQRTEDQMALEKNSTEYLYLELFGCYNKFVSAKQKDSQPVTVALKVSLVTLEEINMKSQKEIARILLEMSWTDANLEWDPSLYGGTNRLTVKAETIWLPDLIVESLDGSFEFVQTDDIGIAVIKHDGTVVIWPYIIAELGMKIEISRYPFDIQTVSFIFGAWSYSNISVRFQLNEKHNAFVRYKENAEWQKLSDATVISNKKYEGYFYDRVGHQVSFRRRWLYYAMNMIGPVVISCLLNLLVFLLPAASGQRVSLAISIFLILTIFLAQINESLPKSSVGVSILVIYLCLQIFGSVLTIFISVLIIYLNQRAEMKEQPKQSKMLSLLCRSVIPKRMIGKFEVKPNSSGTDGVDKQPVSPPLDGDQNQVRQRPMRSMRPPSESRLSQIFSRKMLIMAADYINKSCLWLSILWNIVLLTAVIIVAASGDVTYEIPDLENV